MEQGMDSRKTEMASAVKAKDGKAHPNNLRRSGKGAKDRLKALTTIATVAAEEQKL